MKAWSCSALLWYSGSITAEPAAIFFPIQHVINLFLLPAPSHNTYIRAVSEHFIHVNKAHEDTKTHDLQLRVCSYILFCILMFSYILRKI